MMRPWDSNIDRPPWTVRVSEDGHEARIHTAMRSDVVTAPQLHIGAQAVAFRGRRSGARRGMSPQRYPLGLEDIRKAKLLAAAPTLWGLVEGLMRVETFLHELDEDQPVLDYLEDLCRQANHCFDQVMTGGPE